MLPTPPWVCIHPQHVRCSGRLCPRDRACECYGPRSRGDRLLLGLWAGGLAATALACEALYGLPTGIDFVGLTPLGRLGEAVTGSKLPWNHPVTGCEVFTWDSGPCTMLEKLTALGKTVNLTDVEALLQRVKDEMRRLRRVLTDGAVRAVAEGVEQARGCPRSQVGMTTPAH